MAFTAHVLRRFSDFDMLGHVNNVAYVEYLQEARIQYLTSLGRVDFMNPAQVVAKQEINYRRPLGRGDRPLVIEVSVGGVRERSYVLDYRVLDDDGELAADASTLMVCFDLKTGTSTSIPADVREALTREHQASS